MDLRLHEASPSALPVDEEVYLHGLELQRPWSELLLRGSKSVETRGYALPVELLHVKLAVIETEAGHEGHSGLGDAVEAGACGVHLTGTVTFAECFQYSDRPQWLADTARHCVTEGSG